MIASIWQSKRYRPVRDFICKYKPKKILEIWSWSQWIWRCYDIKFDGLDLSTSDYTWEEKEHNEKMRFINGSALDIPINDNTYDFVFSTDMIEHIRDSDREKAISEAIRICKRWWYVMFLFPCWIYWKLSDYFLFCIRKILSYLKWKDLVPWRLKEHLKIDYPSHRKIDDYLSNIFETEGVKIEQNTKIHSIFIWLLHSLLDLTKFENLKRKVVNKILFHKHNPQSIFWIRKYILLHKK